MVLIAIIVLQAVPHVYQMIIAQLVIKAIGLIIIIIVVFALKIALPAHHLQNVLLVLKDFG